MTKHDYIFIPVNKNSDYEVTGMDLESEPVERKDGPIFSLTLEELRDFWRHATLQHMTNPPQLVYKTFEEYLKTTGLQL